MNSIRTILVIIDPTVLHDHVIDKAKLLAHRTKAKVELFINCQVIGKESSYYRLDKRTASNESAQSGSDELQELLISELRNEFSSLEIPVNIDLCLEKNLPQSILDKVDEIQPDIVLKSTHRHNLLRQTLITNTDWQLIRMCSVPLLLTKPYGWYENGRVVAAVDPLHNSSEQTNLDDSLIAAAEYISELVGQQPGVFHAYYYPEYGSQNSEQNSPQSRDMKRRHNRKMYELLSRHNVDPEFVKIANGDTKIEMMHYLEKIRANVLIIGALARNKLERIVVGSTAEKILDDVPCDLMIMKSKGD